MRPNDDPTHPLQITLRTYILSLSLSLGPSLFPFISSHILSKPSPRTGLPALKRVLRREFGLDGFAFAITVCVGGGAAIRRLWHVLDSPTHQAPQKSVRSAWRHFNTYFQTSKLNSSQKTFLANIFSSSLGVLLLQYGYRRSRSLRGCRASSIPGVPHPEAATRTNGVPPALDLTLLLLVRAVDAILQAFMHSATQPVQLVSDGPGCNSSAEPSIMRDKPLKENAKPNKLVHDLTSRIDAFVFWACSARIMWCFFYEPRRLPRSYVKWIATLASLDERVLHALRLLRDGRWSYANGSLSHSHLLRTFSQELGYNVLWGDPGALPAYGGAVADTAWRSLGVKNRSGIGGLPCELVHGGVGSNLGLEGSCTANSSLRGLRAFVEAMTIYLPVHFIPLILTRPWDLFQRQHTLRTLLGAMRSASFLSGFVASYWYAVCLTRSLVFARLFPFISHDFWDGPNGCILAGCLVCGSTIWIENGRRRGEMALYVLPRAIRTFLPDNWIRTGNKVQIAERVTFILSFSALMTTAIHHPKALRGLSRWTLAFVTNGPTIGLWKQKSPDAIESPEPRESSSEP